METLKIKKLDPDAKVPERATSGSAGLDLCALLKEPLTLSCGDTAVIPTKYRQANMRRLFLRAAVFR